jgi:hypothetical protein
MIVIVLKLPSKKTLLKQLKHQLKKTPRKKSGDGTSLDGKMLILIRPVTKKTVLKTHRRKRS